MAVSVPQREQLPLIFIDRSRLICEPIFGSKRAIGRSSVGRKAVILEKVEGDDDFEEIPWRLTTKWKVKLPRSLGHA